MNNTNSETTPSVGMISTQNSLTQPGDAMSSSKNLIDLTNLKSIGDNVEKAKRRGGRFSWHTLAHIIVMLQKRLAHSKSLVEYVDVTNDVVYWRALALSRGEEIDRFINVIELQKKRIDTLEHDLGTLVNLAQETQKMLADISPEKPAEKARQDEA